MTYANFKLDIDGDGIALITWDVPDRSMNVITLQGIEELAAIVEQLAGDAAVKGAVITSAKETFCAGADLTLLESLGAHLCELRQGSRARRQAARRLFEESRKLSLLYRRIETCGKPWVGGDQRHRASAAASSWRSPATTASPRRTRRRGSACRRSRSACFPAPAAPRASRACCRPPTRSQFLLKGDQLRSSAPRR